MFLSNIKLLSILIGNSGQEQTHAAKPKFKGSCFVSCKSPDHDIEKKICKNSISNTKIKSKGSSLS